MKNLFFYFVCIISLCAVTSCGGDDGDVDCNDGFSVNAEIQDELNALNSAGTTYANDPSESNCNAFKNAANNYLDAVEEIEDCARQAGQLNDWNAAVDASRQAVNSIPC